jgi:low affinity Fe/Cu permease
MIERLFTRIANWVAHVAGMPPTFAACLLIVVVWALSGPFFGFSDTWQLVINTGTTIITFLMVFLIQRSQNKDSLAIHLKLNELVAAMQGASNRLIDVEAFSERELATLHTYYKELAHLARNASDLTTSHSVEEARERHKVKHRGEGRSK